MPPRSAPTPRRLARLAAALGSAAALGCAPRPLPAPGLHPATVRVEIPARRDSLAALVYLPAGEPPPGGWPAVLYLHGGSHRGADLEMLKQYGPPRLLADGWAPRFVVIAPQLPEGEIWSDADRLMALVDGLAARLPLDPDRLYATGISMGGRGAWYLAYRYPGRFAAIAPVAAFQPIAHWAAGGRLRPVAVRAYHGDEDGLAPFAEAEAMHGALSAAGGRSELRVLRGRDHFVADALADPELYEWLLRHRRGERLDSAGGGR